MTDLIKQEPVMFQAIVQAFLAMLTDFGLHMTVNQVASVLAFTAVVLSFWTRQQVTSHPNNSTLKQTPPSELKP